MTKTVRRKAAAAFDGDSAEEIQSVAFVAQRPLSSEADLADCLGHQTSV